MFGRLFTRQHVEDSELAAVMAEANTSIADYVWLPLRFEGEMPFIDWHDEWRIEDFD